eukprot:COSAG02_NODE_2051_length_10000_cov_2.340471_2_plen_208_part_00
MRYQSAYIPLAQSSDTTDRMASIGFYQILGQASNVLDLTFPHPIPTILGYVKLLFLDVRSLVKMDCMNVGGLYGKIVTNVVVVPLAVVIICFLIFEVQRRSLTAVIAAGAADQSAYVTLKVKLKQNLFLGIFLVYPVSPHNLHGVSPVSNYPVLKLLVKCACVLGVYVCVCVCVCVCVQSVTTTLFRVFQCQNFGEASFHEDDYNIE